MKLYHFTLQRNVESIRANGLIPGAEGVVWLTTDPATIHASDLNGNLLAHAHDCRITLVIPSHDRQLISWQRWLRKQGGVEEVEHYLRNPYLGAERARHTIEDWYRYRGVVAPECFREIVEMLPPHEQSERLAMVNQ